MPSLEEILAVIIFLALVFTVIDLIRYYLSTPKQRYNRRYQYIPREKRPPKPE